MSTLKRSKLKLSRLDQVSGALVNFAPKPSRFPGGLDILIY